MKKIGIQGSGNLNGNIRVPGDKSISHRAVMLASLAEGKSILRGLLLGADVRSTIQCFQAMGVPIKIREEEVEIEGVGLQGLKAPAGVLDCGNSGTTLRLIMGILAGQPFTSRLTGDASLNRRPMKRVIEPLSRMGAQIEEMRSSETERIIRIEGRPLKGIRYELPVASAQVKSAILLAGLYASGKTEILEPVPSRDHTELALAQKGAALKKIGPVLTIERSDRLTPEDLQIPGDISSAAFFLVGGLLGRQSQIILEGVGINPTRTGILEVLTNMGGKIDTLQKNTIGGEAVADLRVQASELKGTPIGGPLIPRLIDEIPVLCLAAGRAQGRTQIRDAQELRVKETDRVATTVEELKKMSINIKGLKDGMEVEGPSELKAGQFNSHGDHRIAMTTAIGAVFAEGESIIEDIDCVQTSYPDFWDHLSSLGARLNPF